MNYYESAGQATNLVACTFVAVHCNVMQCNALFGCSATHAQNKTFNPVPEKKKKLSPGVFSAMLFRPRGFAGPDAVLASRALML